MSRFLRAYAPFIFAIGFACKQTNHETQKLKSEQVDPSAVGGANPRVSSSAVPGVKAAWTELGPNSTVIARVITELSTCPQLILNGSSVSMNVRAKSTQAFAVTVCELMLPSDTTSAVLGAQRLQLPKSNPQRIVVLGDTGCRIKEEKGALQLQDCNNQETWPFQQVADSAAATAPDLIIHVGDFHYREANCPVGNQECIGAISGDTWGSWQQDFFAPGLRLLEAAPIVVIRGNHELCARGGNGWFTLLDPRPMPAACVDSTPPYLLQFGDHQLAVIDAADDQNMVPIFNQIKPMPSTLTWWALHRPFLTPGADDEVTGAPAKLPPDWQTAGTISLVLTGHKHLLSYNQFPGSSQPPELINGHGGTYLEKPTVKGQSLNTVTQPGLQRLEWYNYGFATLDRQSEGWALTARNVNGNPVINCKVTEALGTQTNLACTQLDAANVPPPQHPKEKL